MKTLNILPRIFRLFAVISVLILNTITTYSQNPTQSFNPGSYVIDMGQNSTLDKGLKPYGLVYALIQAKVPVYWSINSSKVKDGTDFSAGGKDYIGGPFIISAEDASIPGVSALITTWRANGVVIDEIATPFDAPVFKQLTSWPRAILDAQNDKLITPYYLNAGIPSASYLTQGSPTDLTSCGDMYVLPHADPDKQNDDPEKGWTTSDAVALKNYMEQGGYLWIGCHAVSAMDANPAFWGLPAGYFNLLTTNGLVYYSDHGKPANTAVYTYNPSTAADPIMQFIGTMDASLHNGSEEIYLPKAGSSWRPTTTVALYYDNYTDSKTGVTYTYPTNPAALVAYGPYRGDASMGMVMYETAHEYDDKGTTASDIAAQRAFFNFVLLAGVEQQISIADVTFPAIIAPNTQYTLSANISGTIGSVDYLWDCGGKGSFSSTSTNPTTYTTPDPIEGNVVLRLTVTDACGRVNFVSKVYTPELCSGETFVYEPSDPTATWSRPSYPGILPAGPVSGTGTVSELLINNTTSPVEVTYTFIILIGGVPNYEYVTVTVKAPPTADAGSPLDPICQGGTSAPLGGSVGGCATTGIWSDGGIGGTFSPDAESISTATWTPPALYTGTATLTLSTTDGGCDVATATKTIEVNPGAKVNAGDDQVVCATAPNVTLAGSVSGAATSGTWSGGAGTYNPGNTALNAVYTPTAGEITAGTVTLTLTTNDPAGPCGAVSDNMVITINPVAVANAGEDQTVCATAPNVTLAGSVSGAATSGTWSGGSGTYNPGNTTLNAVYTPAAGEITAGTVTLTLTSNDPAGPCGAVSDEMVITINPVAVANAGEDQTVCASAPNVTLAGSVSGAATSGIWSGGSGTYNPGNTTLNAVYTPAAGEITAGTVTLTLTSNDPAGPCGAVSDNMVITISESTSVKVNSPTICGGSGPAEITATPSSAGNFTYAWTVPSGATDPGNVASFMATVPGTYSVTITDSNSCTGSGSGTLTINPTLTATTTHVDVTCPGRSNGSATAVPAGGTREYTYSWNTIPVQTSVTASGLAAGTYIVTVTDAFGCKATAEAVVGTVPDITDPVITVCAANQSAAANVNCQAIMPDFRLGIVATDNCTPGGSLVITQSPVAGTPSGVGVTIVTLTVEDAVGNSVSCSATFTVLPTIIANDDSGSVVNGLLGGTSFVNVLSNDLVNCQVADVNNVNITSISSTNPKVTLNGTNVVVAPETPTGTYFLVYEICDKLNPGFCDRATVTVPVVTPAPSNIIDAIDDSGAVNGITGGVAVPDVLWNDKLNGVIVLPSQVILTFISSTNPNVTLNGRQVEVAPGTAAGTYYVTYRICETQNPTNCDQAIVTVVVTLPVNVSMLDAIPDEGTICGINGGVAVPNVLWNDLLNNQPVVPSEVVTTFVGTSHPNVTLNGTSVVVAPNTPSGMYYLDYRICEVLNPTNCDQGTVTIKVKCPNENIDITKASIDNTFSAVGDLIHYTLNVMNTGDVNSFYNLIVTDPNAMITSGNPIGILAPGTTATLTAVHTITQADIDAGKVLNAAIVNGTDPDGDPLTDTSNLVVVNGLQRPQITITKYSSELTFHKVGEVISYTFEIFNCGNVTAKNIEVWDENAVMLTGAQISSLAPRHTVIATAEHKVTQADMDSGKIVNIAKVRGIDPMGNPVRDDSNEVILYANQQPRLIVAKFAEETSFSKVGDTIHYTIAVKNYRNTIMSDIVVSDPNAIITSGTPIFRLASGSTVLAYAYHIITQADLNAGKVVNVAVARGRDYYDYIDKAFSNEVTIFAAQSPLLVLTKTAEVNSYNSVDDLILYTHEIKNAGNVNITGITLMDPNTIVVGSNHISSLSPGESATIRTAHTITQADLNLGMVEKTASLTAYDANIQPMRVVSNTVTVKGIQKSQLSASLSSAETTYSIEGDVIHYSIEVRNSGNVTLTNLKISDAITGKGLPLPVLMPGSTSLVTVEHLVTHPDVVAGQLTNMATTTGYSPAGEKITNLSNQLTIVANKAERLIVTKIAQEYAYAKAGEVIHYNITVKNHGKVPISNITVTVPNAILSGSSVIASLPASGTATLLASRIITQSDLNAGQVCSDATITGSFPDDKAYEEKSNMVTVYAVKDPALTTSISAAETEFKAVGDQIHYLIEVTNTGNMSLSDIALLSDGNLTISSNQVPNLEPGETARLFAEYTASVADLDLGKVVRSVRVTGKDPDMQPLYVSSNEVSLAGLQNPELSTLVTAAETIFSSVGEVIHYSILVTNSGNMSIISTAVTDPNAVIIDARPSTILLPGESFPVAASHTVTQNDIDAGMVVSTAKAEGFDLKGTTITRLGNKVTVLGVQRSELTIDNNPSASTFNQVGDVIDYSILIKNLGNTTVFDLKVTDPNAVISNTESIPSVRPGESITVSGFHAISQADLDAGKIVNEAKAAGFDLRGNPVEKTAGQVTILGMQHPDLNPATAASTLKYKNVGDVIVYTVLVRNTGNITMNNIRIMDANAELDFNGTIRSLAPGAIDSLTAEYKVTIEDINAGKIVNAGIAKASDVNNQLHVYQSKEVTVKLAIEKYNLTNFPNPFAYETTIVFDLPEKGKVLLRVYDITGREVGQIDKQEFNEGRNFVQWRTIDVPKGLYILKMLCNGEQAVRRIIIGD